MVFDVLFDHLWEIFPFDLIDSILDFVALLAEEILGLSWEGLPFCSEEFTL
jgi:hypothetical protein